MEDEIKNIILDVVESLTKDVTHNYTNMKEVENKIFTSKLSHEQLIMHKIDQMSYFSIAKIQQSIATALLKSLK